MAKRGQKGASRGQASAQVIATLRQANALHEAGRLAEAEQGYRAVLQADPNNADALHMFGVLASQVGNLPVADQLISGAIAIRGDDAVMHFNHAVVLQTADRLDDAIAAYRRAVRLKPQYREAFENLGVALADSGDLKAAKSAYQNAIRLGDTSAIARHNLAALERDLGDFASAEANLERALEINPAYPDAHLKLVQTRLAHGDLAGGLQAFEWRNHAADSGSRLPQRACPLPVYPGGPPGRILVEAEQGVGDEVMFASCLVPLIEQSERCVVQCDSRLLPLFARSFPDAEFMDSTGGAAALQSAGTFDWRLPAGSLPRHFRRRLEDFGDGDAYLVADTVAVDAFRERLDALPGTINVGLSWRGGNVARARAARSLSLSSFDWLLSDERYNVINLQYGNHDAEIREQGSGLVCWDDIDPLNELDDFCALVKALDVVVSVDNSTVHFAGALGVPALVLVSTTGEWRWMGNERSDTPWYRSLKLFHQRAYGDWTEVLQRVADALGTIQATERTAMPESGNGHIVPLPNRAGTLLLNDTSGWGHWGHACTSIGLLRLLEERHGAIDTIPAQQTLDIRRPDLAQLDDESLLGWLRDEHAGVVDAVESCDRLVINGDDMLAWPGGHALALLRLAKLARTIGPTHIEIVNHSVVIPDELDALYRDIYTSVDRVVVRDPRSAESLRALGIDVVQGFDCLPLLVDTLPVERGSAARSCLTVSGSLGLAPADIAPVIEALNAARERGYDVEVLLGAPASPAPGDLQLVEALHGGVDGGLDVRLAPSETEWLSDLASSNLVLTGSFHHALAAAWLDVPWLALPVHAASIAGLHEQTGSGVISEIQTFAGDVQRCLDESPDKGIPGERREELLALCGLNASGD